LIGRRLRCGSLALTPLAAARSRLRPRGGNWPRAWPIKWDRDTCVRCNMVISDRASPPRCAAARRMSRSSSTTSAARLLAARQGGAASLDGRPGHALWVADAADMGGATWLDARKAHYLGGGSRRWATTSPPYADAVPQQPDFRRRCEEQVLAKGK
jgi:copper chaperone NosL